LQALLKSSQLEVDLVQPGLPIIVSFGDVRPAQISRQAPVSLTEEAKG